MNSTNATSSTGSVDFTMRVMRLALYPAVLLLGIVGNLIVCLVIMNHRYKSSRPTTRYFVLSLAISDLVVLLMFIPFDMAYLEYEIWMFGEVMCKVVNTISYSFVTISGTTLAAISIDRHRAIVYPMRQPFSRRIVWLIVVSIWVYAILTLLPFAGSLRLFPDGQCLNDPSWWTSHHAYQMTFLFSCLMPGCVIPLACISMSYICIARFLYREHHRQVRAGIIGSCTADVRARQNWKTTRVLTALVIVYIICVVPHYIITAMVFFDHKDTVKLPYIVESHEFTRLLMTANSCLNPIMYSAVSKEFRLRLKVLCCFKKKASASINPILCYTPVAYNAVKLEMLSPAKLLHQTRYRTSSFL